MPMSLIKFTHSSSRWSSFRRKSELLWMSLVLNTSLDESNGTGAKICVLNSNYHIRLMHYIIGAICILVCIEFTKCANSVTTHTTTPTGTTHSITTTGTKHTTSTTEQTTSAPGKITRNVSSTEHMTSTATTPGKATGALSTTEHVTSSSATTTVPLTTPKSESTTSIVTKKTTEAPQTSTPTQQTSTTQSGSSSTPPTLSTSDPLVVSTGSATARTSSGSTHTTGVVTQPTMTYPETTTHRNPGNAPYFNKFLLMFLFALFLQ